MDFNQDKVSFYKEKIEACKRAIALIHEEDPYKAEKLKSMNYRISLYQEELNKIDPQKLLQ